MSRSRLFKPFSSRIGSFVWSRDIAPISARFRWASTDATSEEANLNRNKVVGHEDDFQRKPRPWRINWPRLKRSWVHFQKYIAVFQAPFTNERIHEGKRRMFKNDHILYYFRDRQDLDYWYVNTDEEIGGQSWAEITQGANEMTMLFRGNLNKTKPTWLLEAKPSNEMLREFTPTAFVETKLFITIYDRKEHASLAGFNAIRLKIRGDGRRYWFEIKCNKLGGREYTASYRYPIYTRGGPLWEIVEVESFRFMINDNMDGPFQLEVDSIALTNHTGHEELTTFFGDNKTDVYDAWEKINKHSGS